MRGDLQGLGYMIGGSAKAFRARGYKILQHYEIKSTKTFRPTNVLHVFTKF